MEIPPTKHTKELLQRFLFIGKTLFQISPKAVNAKPVTTRKKTFLLPVITFSFFMTISPVSINIMSLIGLVVITGIVINDSILKVDTINRLVRGGMDVDAAVHEAGHRRIKAIIMTSITTVFSVLPFLSRGNMGSDLQYPMAIVIVVGMTVGTAISLFFLPALYSAVYARRKR